MDTEPLTPRPARLFEAMRFRRLPPGWGPGPLPAFEERREWSGSAGALRNPSGKTDKRETEGARNFGRGENIDAVGCRAVGRFRIPCCSATARLSSRGGPPRLGQTT